jgi:hypothetical protein
MFTLSFHDQVHMGVLPVGVQHHCIAALMGELLAREFANGCQVGAHRAERRNVRAIIASCFDQDDRRLYAKEYGDPWCSPKDGKVFTSDPRDLRKWSSTSEFITMSIDGFDALIQYDPDIKMFRGEFVGLNGGADFYAKSIDGLAKEGPHFLETLP